MGQVPARQDVVLNGKWLAQPLTGTQRYAQEVTRHLLDVLPVPPTVVVPADAVVPDWLSSRSRVRRSRLRGNLFEQVALPWAARSSLVLSLGGAAPLLARRQVATVHDVTPFRFPQTYSRLFRVWYRLLYRRLARRAARIITVSKFSASEITDVLGVEPERIALAPNGSDHVDVVVPERPDLEALDAPYVLVVGTLAQHKNVDPVVRALGEAGIRCVVVGARGPSRIFTETSGSRWPGAVVAGRLTDAEIVWLYRHAVALAFPSLYEGFGLPIVEAQRLGCPVVVSDRGPCPEVSGGAGIIVPADDADAFVDAVRRIMSDGELAASLREAGATNASRYTWAGAARRIAEVITAR